MLPLWRCKRATSSAPACCASSGDDVSSIKRRSGANPSLLAVDCSRWLSETTHVRGTATVVLGPEPIIGPQEVELGSSAAPQDSKSAPLAKELSQALDARIEALDALRSRSAADLQQLPQAEAGRDGNAQERGEQHHGERDDGKPPAFASTGPQRAPDAITTVTLQTFSEATVIDEPRALLDGILIVDPYTGK